MTTLSFRARRHAVSRWGALALALLVAVPLGTSVAEARAGGGSSFGSRGTRSFSMPPSTSTAPRSAQPLPRDFSPGGASSFGAAASQPRRFGFGSGLAAGLLGAGLFGLLTGGSLFGGLDGLASMFGLLVQVALIGGLVLLALRFFRGRQSGGPAFAGASRPGASAGAFGGMNRTAAGGLGGGGAVPIELAPQDFDAFERALVAVQTAYGREDVAALSRLATPDMLRHFGQDIEDNRRRGLRNDVGDVRLLQGDLAEAWREGSTDYGTVAMRFAARDTMVDRGSGRVIEGDAGRPAEATELWTFRRDRGGPWLVSAIQQAA